MNTCVGVGFVIRNQDTEQVMKLQKLESILQLVFHQEHLQFITVLQTQKSVLTFIY